MDIDLIPRIVKRTAALLGINMVDVSDAAEKLDFYFPELGIFGQCKSSGKFRAIEVLIDSSLSQPHCFDRQYRQSLLEAQEKLQAAQKGATEQFRKYIARIQSGLDPIPDGVSLSFDQLLEIFNQRSAFSYTAPIGLLRLLLDGLRARNLLKRVFARIATILKANKPPKPSFCGLTWSRRLWFLLHGSHPPKTGSCIAFGCA